jgi:hypothetical protein
VISRLFIVETESEFAINVRTGEFDPPAGEVAKLQNSLVVQRLMQ